MAMDEKGLGRRIQHMRKDAGLTQQDLCGRTGLSYSTLTKIERGAIKSPSVFTIQGIARTLNITLDELLGDVTRTDGSGGSAKRTSPSGVKFIYFDVNGCLVRSFQRAFDILAKETNVPQEIIQSTYEHYDAAVCRGDMSLDEFNEALARQVGRLKINWVDYYLRAVEPVKGMTEILQEVAHEYRVGILTNIVPTVVKALRARGDIPDVQYDAVVESCDVRLVKPSEEMFALATERAGLSPNEILLVDDTRTNLLAAETYGWQTLWFDDYFPDQSVASLKTLLGVS